MGREGLDPGAQVLVERDDPGVLHGARRADEAHLAESDGGARRDNGTGLDVVGAASLRDALTRSGIAES